MDRVEPGEVQGNVIERSRGSDWDWDEGGVMQSLKKGGGLGLITI